MSVTNNETVTLESSNFAHQDILKGVIPHTISTNVNKMLVNEFLLNKLSSHLKI